MLDRSKSGKVANFAASVSSGNPTSKSSIGTARSTDNALGASKAAVWVAKPGSEFINAQAEPGSVDGLELTSVVFSELSTVGPCEMTGNNSDCPKGAGDRSKIVVAKDGVDGLPIEYGKLLCSRYSETSFAISTEGCGVLSTVGVQ